MFYIVIQLQIIACITFKLVIVKFNKHDNL